MADWKFFLIETNAAIKENTYFIPPKNKKQKTKDHGSGSREKKIKNENNSIMSIQHHQPQLIEFYKHRGMNN